MSRPRRQGPSPDGRHDDLSPAEWQALSLDVPDDASELDADRAQWLREQTSDDPLRIAGNGSQSLAQQRRGQRLVLTAVVLLLSMLVVTVSGLLASLAIVPATSSAPAAPLAAGDEPAGQIGGLLPVAGLTDGATPVSARSLRPGVLALVPESCANCSDLIRQVAQQAAQFDLSLTLIGRSEQSQQVSNIEGDLGSMRLDTLTDSTGAFVDTFGNTDPTFVLVRDDGVIVDIVRDFDASTRLDSSLVRLVPSLGSGS